MMLPKPLRTLSAILFIPLLAALLTACSRSLPGPDFPRPQGEYPRNQIFRTARDLYSDRMKLVGDLDKRGDSSHRTIYRTLWLTDEGDQFLVCLQSPPGGLGGFNQWDLYLYDRDIEMIDYGVVHVRGGAHPLCIVEVKPVGDHLPGTRNGVWQLAVVFVNERPRWKTSGRLPMWSSGEDPTGRYPSPELIHWQNDLFGELKFGSGNLDDLDSIKYRTAEPAAPVGEDGTMYFREKP